MPPKKKGGPQKASKKAEQKENQKIIEDKTFGLKNKNKSKKVQNYVKSVQQQVENRGRKHPPPPSEAQIRKEEKRKREEQKRETELLMKTTVQQPKVPAGVDPKSFVCELFKRGLCLKGDRCKYSHDLSVGTKSKQKIDLYTDKRDISTKDGGMENWDQTTLETVVNSKRSAQNRANKTTIVCKYFLEALETQKYGWFWECPNGDNCQYVHALPPGFVMKKREPKGMKSPDEEDEPGLSLEEVIEIERAKIKDGEPVTAESFARWKAAKKAKKEEEEKKDEEAKKKAISSGKTVLLSGRELLIYKPQVFVDDEEALGSGELERMTEEEYDAQLNMEDDEDNAADEVGDESLFMDDDDDEEGEEGEEGEEEGEKGEGENKEEEDGGDKNEEKGEEQA